MNETRIEWTDMSWNPVTGCSAVSEGCMNCYARRMAHRLRGRLGHPADEPFRVTLHPERLEEPLKLRKPSRIFVCSMGDLFHEDVPMEFIAEVFNVMACATADCDKRHKHSEECWGGPPHTFLVLTKRPRSMKQALDDLPEWVEEHWADDAPLSLCLEAGLWPLHNVWLGISAENQAAADERIPILLQTPAAVRWVSVEPMLGPVDMRRYLSRPIERRPTVMCADGYHGCCIGGRAVKAKGVVICTCECHGAAQADRLDWIVCGGETGPGARPMHPDWVRSLRDQAVAADVPFFFKGWGEWLPNVYGDQSIPPGTNFGVRHHMFDDGLAMAKVGRKRAGRLLDGREWNEYPGRQVPSREGAA